MWKCVRCNKENQDSAEKCINCGHGKTMDYTGHRSVSRLRPEMTNNWKKKKEKSMLMAGYMGNDKAVFGSKLLRKEVCKIDFVKMNLASIPSGAWDVSKDQDRTIWAWKRETPEGYTLYIGSEKGVYANKDCDYLFRDYLNVKKINFNNLFDTSHVTNMCCMFSECESLEELDVSGFDTGSVEDMGHMFGGCKNLKNLDVSGFNTSSAEDMGAMFKDCENLKSLDVSGFDTGSVKNMWAMFESCKNLKSLDVSGFDTGSVEDMGRMFGGCKNLKNLDVSGFNTSSAEDMGAMFKDCENLKSLDVSGFDTGSVKNMWAMFESCKNLKSLDVSGFDTGSVEGMQFMFSECEALSELDVSGFDTRNVIDMGYMFYDCKNLEKLDVGEFNTSRVTDMKSMFSGCKKLKSLDVSNFNTKCVANMEYMFYRCFKLTQLDTSNFYYAPGVNRRDMFNNCGSKEHYYYYDGDSIEEICADFLSYEKNAIFNNGWEHKKWVLCHALEIPAEEKIYLLHDASINSLTNLLVGKIAVTKAEGFAITDKGIYMKKEYDKRKVFMPWERLKEANIDIDFFSNVRVDEIPVAFSWKNSVDRAKLQELVCLFKSIRRFLNGGSV